MWDHCSRFAILMMSHLRPHTFAAKRHMAGGKAAAYRWKQSTAAPRCDLVHFAPIVVESTPHSVGAAPRTCRHDAACRNVPPAASAAASASAVSGIEAQLR